MNCKKCDNQLSEVINCDNTLAEGDVYYCNRCLVFNFCLNDKVIKKD